MPSLTNYAISMSIIIEGREERGNEVKNYREMWREGKGLEGREEGRRRRRMGERGRIFPEGSEGPPRGHYQEEEEEEGQGCFSSCCQIHCLD